MQPDNIEDIYPLSPVQQGILFHTLYAPQAGEYYRQLVFAVRGDLDTEIFARTWQEIVDRYSILRTAFVWEDVQEPVQVVCRRVEVSLEQWDWRALAPAEQEQRLAELLLTERRTGLELSEAPLMRLSLFVLGDQSYRFVWSYHHLLLDGWSVALVLRRVFAVYRALTRGDRPPLDRVRPYRDFIAWLKAQDPSRAEAFWRHALAGFRAPTPLPLEPAAADTEPRIEDRLLTLSVKTTAALHTTARAHRLTLNTLLQGAWALLLSRYSGEPEVVFGATVSGRPTELPGFESMVGLFINTLPVRAPVPAEAELIGWLRRLQASQAEVRQLEHSALADVIRWSDLPRGQTLFESILVFENYRLDEAIPDDDSRLEVRRLDLVDGSSYPLTLIVRPETRIVLRLLHEGSRFSGDAALRLLHHLGALLEGFAADPSRRLTDIPSLTAAERQQIVVEWNATEDAGIAGEEGLCLHELFSRQARRSSDALALVCEDAMLTYRDLDRLSSQLARHLLSLGAGPETRVGLCLERSLEMVVGLLGVLKCGAAYVPIDPSYPAQRQAWMLEDSAVPVILTLQRLVSQLPATAARLLPLDTGWETVVAHSEEDPHVLLADEHLAYVIYTSGSTGRPKGAMNTHRAVRNRILWMQEAYPLDESDRVLQKTPFSFDVSVWELFWPLLTGARLVLARPEGHRDPSYLAGLIRAQGVTTLHFVPPMLQVFLQEPAAAECSSLRRVICSGEALPAELARRFYACLDAELHNLYGPTEAAVDVTAWACERDSNRRSIPIGRPIANLRIHLLDRHLQPAPMGAPAELHIGGAGLARGYLGRPGLTAEKFVPDPLAAAPGDRLYKTGDLARFRPDGAIEFLGRLDHQVKVRGFRIELGEVEAELTAHPAVREVVVLARDDDGGGKRLIAYVVADRQLLPGELRAFLQARLPEQMVPALFVALPALPLGPNGKVDRAALPVPRGTREDSSRLFVAPRTAVEEELAEIWREVLRLDRVGRDDNFFELGGDSIRSIQVLARARARGLSLTLPQLFRSPVLRDLALQVGEEPEEEELPAQLSFGLLAAEDRSRLPAGIVDAYPLALLQAGMLFHSELRPDTSVYHDVFSYHFKVRFELAALRRTLSQVLARHPVLRTSFHLTGFSEPLQMVHAEVEVPLALEDLRSLPEAEQQRAAEAWIEREKRTPLRWDRPPLLRFQVHLRSGGSFQLTLSFHHAILDGWSIAAMLTELFQGYLGEIGLSDAPPIPPPAVELRQFVALERAAVESEESRRFWLETLADSAFLKLPRHGGSRAAELRVRRVAIPVTVAERLGSLAAEAAVPLKSVLLAAHLRVLALVSEQTGGWDVTTGLVTNGRPEVADGDRVLGLFLNTLPLRLKSAAGSWLDLIRETFEAERQMLAHRRFPLAELQRLLGGQPLFEIVFNYVHFHVRETLGRVAGVQALGGSSYEETSFPLFVNFRLRPSATAVELDLRYDAGELSGEQVEAFAGYYARALGCMVSAPLARCEIAPLLTAAERHQLVIEWNDTVTATLGAPAHRLFEAQVERTPEAPAIVFADRSLTYCEVNRLANRLAHRLRREGVGPEVPVALAIERSPEMVIGILAVLKAGGVYVPLDPSHPRHRLELLLEDLDEPLLLANGEIADVLAPRARRTLRPDLGSMDENESSNPEGETDPDSLAYILFTSGSTGRPKGVGIAHRSLVNFLGSIRRFSWLGEGGILVAVTTISFDIAGIEIFLPLIVGARVVIADHASAADGEALGRLLAGADVLQATPATWRILLESGWSGDPGLRMLCGGEALSRELADRLLGLGADLWNLYGPTETTIYSTLEPVAPETGPVMIGKPIANTEVHLLDSFLQPVPVGVPAELWISGEGLARGYFRQPGVTAERFLPDPFARRPGSRMYRTGDLARRHPDGRVEHLGRIDHQLKLRGFRIEPGEIESVLLQHVAVRQALVVLRQDAGDPHLVAYVVAESRPSLVSELRDLMRASLPEYMLPRAVTRLEAFPLTPSGKVDRRALPEPDSSGREISRAFVAPRSPVEELLAGIWSDVLRLDRVGAQDDFFALGGHSLSATRVVARIREAFSVEFPLRELFASPILSDLANRLEERLRAGMATAAALLTPIPGGGDPVLSFGQERLWFLDQLEPESAAYNIPLAVRLEGTLESGALAWAFAEVVRRHEILRSTFPSRDGQPALIVAPPGPPAFVVVDLDGISGSGREVEIRRLAREEFQQPFDLAAGPLLRIRLLRLGKSEHALLATVHHIASDAWSMGLLVHELSALYDAFVAGRPSPLQDLPIQYGDFACWQRQALQGEALEGDVAYWRGRLLPPPAGLDLPMDRPRPTPSSSRGRREPFPISPDLAARLRRASQREGASLFMLLLAAFQTLLHRYSGQMDIAVGSPIAGRTRVETEALIGFFINTLVLRCNLEGDPSFAMLLRQVREVCLDAHAHQHLPFERLVESLQPERTLTQPPFFQVMLVLQNTPRAVVELPGLRMSGLDLGSEAAKFDLTLTIRDDGTTLGGSLLYRTELWDRPTIARLLEHLTVLLSGAVADPGRSLSTLPLLSETERAQLLAENDGDLSPPSSGFFHRVFEAQAHANPDAEALVFEEERWSYAELNQRANRLARVLRARGVKPEAAVGLCLERSGAAILGMLAIFKAGGACVPLDPALPIERLVMMLTESRAAWIVTESRWRDALGPHGRERALCLDELAAEIAAESGANLDLPLAAENLAYVLFTSGSTGRSKGVAVEHRQLLHYVRAVSERLGLEPRMSFATVSTLAADLGHTAIFPTLCLGGCLHVISEARIADADALAEYLERRPVDGLKIVPSHLTALHGSLAARTRLLPRRVLVLGGEASFHADVASLQALAPGLAIFNHYGPTETTVGVLAGRFDPAERTPSSTVPLGRPLAGARAYVLDRHLRLLPYGLPGELCIGGPSLSRGYLHRPELTAERFVPDPFGPPGGRLYRTGDLVRHRPGERFEFLGRNDDQIKRRGFRIELGEIVAALRRHPGLREAVVIPRKEPGAQLVAYGVSRTAARPSEPELRAFLRQQLPEPMIPDAFVLLPELPLTPNGKVDRAALPAPDRGSARVSGSLVPPRTPGEEILAGLWGELLGIEEIGVRDSFFDLGGHSLLATRLISRVRRSFAVDLPLRALFERPTIEGLAAEIERRRASRGREIPPLGVVPRGSGLPLSFGQQRLWILAQMEPDSPAYNVPMALRLEGDLEVSALRWALSEVTRRHEVLRTRFVVVDGEPVQVTSLVASVPLPVVDLAFLPEPQRNREARRLAAEEALRPFDLEHDPPMRAGLIRLGRTLHVALLTLHHIASDAWSRDILRREITALYAGAMQGSPPDLPALPVQYGDFASWQRSWMVGERLEMEIAYWREQLAGAPRLLELPTDRPRPAVESFRGASVPLLLSADLSAELAALARRQGATLFMVLLAGFQVLLSRYCHQDDVSVGTPIAGRNHLELEGLIGFFVNTLVLRGRLAGPPSVESLLGRVREVVLEAHAHQDLPFEKLVGELHPGRNLAYTPLFQVMLVLQSATGLDVTGPGPLRTSRLEVDAETAKFDLTLVVQESRGAGVSLSLSYRTDLFDSSTARRMLCHLETLLRGLVADPAARTSALPMLAEAELHQALREWNDTQSPFPEGLCLHEIFAAQAARCPEREAVVCAGERMRYADLDSRSERFGRRLRALGLEVEERVGLWAERSPGLIVAVLGILRAGGAYLPLDPSNPPERLAWMLGDAGAKVLVAERRLLAGAVEALSSQGLRVICLDDLEAAAGAEGELPEVSPENLAYVMYTSGSTGVPKGVAATHRNVIRLVRGASYAAMGPQEVWLQYAPVSFDASTLEIWAPLLNGGRLVLFPGSRASLDELAGVIRGEGVTSLWLTAGLFHQMVDERLEGLLPLRQLLAGGDVVSPAHARRLLESLPGLTLIDGYGPTEGTTFATCHRLTEAGQVGGTVPIGRPIDNARVYLVDGGFQPVPVGVAGELCVAGEGLARGYLDRPDLTAASFVPDPFGEPGGRMYRTGDRARLLAPGAIEFLGRFDAQVKVRGFRIEPGEIEAALLRHPRVDQAVVLAREDRPGDRRLVAYVVSGSLAAGDEGELINHLRRILPEPMVPSRIVFLESLPLTPNGKVSRRDLPAPDSPASARRVAPQTPEEEILAGIWCEVLGLTQVGVEDDFFELGGHSLLATRVLSRTRSVLGVELPLRALFENPTLKRLAAVVAESRSTREDEVLRSAIEELEGLSDEEVLLLLAEQRRSAEEVSGHD